MSRFNLDDLPQRYQEQARKQLGEPKARNAPRGRPEANFQQQVVDLAHLHRWRVFHSRRAKQANGEHRTAVAYEGAGFPDLVLAKAGRLLIAELKSGHGTLRPNQREWRAELEGSSHYRLWHPSDWDEIERELSGRKPPRPPQPSKYDGVDWSKSTSEIARELGVSASAVCQARHRRGVRRPHPGRPPRADWDSVDWTRIDAEIARDVGVSRERVRQKRRALGARDSVKPHERRREQLQAMDTSQLTLEEVARELGVSKHAARVDLRKLGRSVSNGGVKAKPVAKWRPNEWKYDWDAIDWANRFDSEIARELGCAVATVTMTRKRQKRPRGPDGRRVSPHRFKARRRLLKLERPLMVALSETPGLTVTQLAERLDVREAAVYRVVQRLFDRGRVSRAGRGLRSDPYRYEVTQ